MLIGFEDIDFSLRLFREGMKVATSSLQFLVHDHPKADSSSDADYERTRYSRKILYDSALHLEAKTGFRIWGDEVESWMRSSEKKQGWASDAEATAKRPSVDQREAGAAAAHRAHHRYRSLGVREHRRGN